MFKVILEDGAIRWCTAFSRASRETATALHLSGSDVASTGSTALISLAFAPRPANVTVFFRSGLSYRMVSAGLEKFKHPHPFTFNHLQAVMLLMDVI